MLPKPKKFVSCLRQHFGLDTFKPLQWQIINQLIGQSNNGGDVCAVIATGYGKSLTYQFPAFYLNKVVVVVSPLIALMEEQVSALNRRGECACLLGTAQGDRAIKERVLALQFRLVYATPEYITRGNGLKLVRDLGHSLALIAVDEAHCISKWGHEFRPAYRQLSQLRLAAPRVRLLALTGTATERVRRDICEQLALRRPLLLRSGMDRPNLELTVRPKGASLWSDLQPYLSWAQEAAGSVIVYNNTIRDTEQTSGELARHGLPCRSYHSKLAPEEKRRHQQDFASDRVRIVAATTAFGLGIDKPDVRLVVHYGAPSDMERYYQEIGRAGRDHLAAKCVLFYGAADASNHRRMQHRQPLTAQRSAELERMATAMARYTASGRCRRQLILEYFDDHASLAGLRRQRQRQQPRSNCCDNCRKARRPSPPPAESDPGQQLDVSVEARLLLAMLRDLNGRVGLGKLILGLRGSRSKCLSGECRRHENFGAVAHRSPVWLRALAEQLKELGYVREEYQHSAQSAFGYPMPQVTLSGCCWLDSEPSERVAILAPPGSRLAQLQRKRRQRPQKVKKAPLDWGSDIDVDALDEMVEREREREQEQEQVNETVWGPDMDIDFEQIDQAVAQSLQAPPSDPGENELEALIADCHKILDEEQEEAARTRKARKRVWQYLEGSYQKRPLIPKYKSSRRAPD